VRTATVLSVLIFVMMAVSARAADFWPEGEGLTWEYQWSNVVDDIPAMVVESSKYRLSLEQPPLTVEKVFAFDEDANVVVESIVYWYEEYAEPVIREFDPPLLFLRFPLIIGDSWTTITDQGGVICRVLREEDLEVPAGEFRTIVVQMLDLTSVTGVAGDYYLNREVGPVLVPDCGGLVSYNFGVPIDASSWGSLKALYR
jgi:hypothetical protein